MMLKRLIVIVLVALSVQISAAQDATATVVNPDATEETTTVSPKLEQQMTALESITEKLRHLTAEEPVEHQFPTRQETIDYLRATYDREFPREQFDQLELFYVALGLLPAEIDLQDVYLNLLNSQVAGFYDPDTKTMNVIPTIGDSVGTSLSVTEQVIYVHEFTHALQDQYFDLNTLQEAVGTTLPDRALALTSLIEGDATAVMTLYLEQVAARNPLAVLGMLLEGAQAGNLVLPPGVPPILANELLFPYENGMNFILALNAEGGWDEINAAFANPPTTTEQIMHPEKYLAGEGAQEVALSDMSTALGDGWTDAWDTTLGEFYLRAHLATELSSTEARQAAAGWGGDHFRVYQNGDQIAWALRLAWDTAGDSDEFNETYSEYGDKRFGGSPDADGCWQNADGALCLLHVTAGAAESYIVSAPTVAQAKALAGM